MANLCIPPGTKKMCTDPSINILFKDLFYKTNVNGVENETDAGHGDDAENGKEAVNGKGKESSKSKSSKKQKGKDGRKKKR